MLPHRRRPIARLRDCLISCVVYPLSQLEEPPHETSARPEPMTSRRPQASLRVGVLERERLAALVKSLMPAQRQCALPALASRWNWRWLRLPHQLASSRAYRATFARSCFSQPSSSLFGLL